MMWQRIGCKILKKYALMTDEEQNFNIALIGLLNSINDGAAMILVEQKHIAQLLEH